MLIVKIGGGKDINISEIAKDLSNIIKTRKVVLVHGANARRDELAKKLQIPTKVVTSPSGVDSVFTDQEAIEVFLMAYPGLVNKQVVAILQRYGINAVGLSGIDGRLWEGRIKSKLLVKEGGKTMAKYGNLSGKVEKANPQILFSLLEGGFVPVITAPGISYDHQIMNTDNDTATAIMAEAVEATEIVSLFEAPGLLKDYKDPQSLIKRVDKAEIEGCLEYADGRMKKKILGAKMAMERGVKKIYFADSRVFQPITKALQGEGTEIS
jgi:[amino group carrier protein]-L-2-aminoadipate 6-kinase